MRLVESLLGLFLLGILVGVLWAFTVSRAPEAVPVKPVVGAPAGEVVELPDKESVLVE